MTRFYGSIGFADGEVETSPGVWNKNIVEHKYRGEIAMLPKCIADRHFVSEKPQS